MTLVRFQNQIPEIFRSFFENEFGNTERMAARDTFIPAVNILENNDAFTIEMAVPGFKKRDFHIEVNDGVLTVSAEKEMVSEEKENEWFIRKEFTNHSFARSFTLPELVESDDIKAKYENGILRVTVPKMEQAKPKPVRKIKIS